MKRLTLLLVLAAACGSKSKPDTTEPTPAAPDAGAAAVEAAPPDAAPAPDPKEEALAAEKTAYDAAETVFLSACGNCHIQGGVKATQKTLARLDLTSYPFTGDHASPEAIRKVLGIDGSKPTMPKNKPGSVQGDDLAAIQAWANAADAAEAAGAHAE